MDKERIQQLVRRVVYRTLGMPSGSTAAGSRPLVTESDVQAVPPGSQLVVPNGTLITPLARQRAQDQRVTLIEASLEPPRRTGSEAIAIGADHGGFQMKEMLKGYLAELGRTVMDCGTDSTASVDYPDFAFAVAQLVAQGQAQLGIVIDGAGIGSCMAANKVPGVRAAMCYDQATAANSREHNHANVLTLGAGLIGPSLAKQIVKTWLETPVGGGAARTTGGQDHGY